MESIAELRKICQETAKRDKSNVYMRYVSRFLSIYLTRAILPTSISANQVSVAMIAMGFISCFFFLLGSKGAFFSGAILLQLWYLLDCMDGEVARYRHYKATGSIIINKNESSLTGLYYDMINHYIVNFLVPFTIGFGIFVKTGVTIWILLAGLGSLAQILMLAMHDAKCRAILSHLKKYTVIHPKAADVTESKAPRDRSLLHKAFMAFHYTITYPTVMNLVGFAALMNLFLPFFDWRIPIFLYISLGTTIVASVLIWRILKNQIVDRELKNSFNLRDQVVAESNPS